jgi:4-hydroxy-3-polyprenylbenzoate decarboxylase
MSYHCLADFLEQLRQAGELVRIEAEVDPVLEAAEITGRTAHSGGPALLFGAVQGHEPPLLTNLLGTEKRFCLALGIESPAELSQRIAELVDPAEPEGWFEKIQTAGTRAVLRRLPPRTLKTGACQQIVRLGSDVDLEAMPVLRSYPLESGRVITAGQLFTADAESGRWSVGRYDLQVLERNRLAACWLAHDDPARLMIGYRERKGRMPLAVVLGGDPAGLLAAMAPLPPEADVSALAGLLREKPLELVKCRTVELEVPTDAEIVIEGYVDPAEPPVDVGLLAASGGTYQLARPAPVMHVTALTHRANPIYPAMVPGTPPDDACVVNRALQRVFLPLVRSAIPELVDYDLPTFGAARHWALISIRKTYAGQARKVAHAAWAVRPLMFAKLLVVVDQDVDVRNHQQVLSAISSHVDPGRDVFFDQGPPDPRDPAAPPEMLRHTMAIDATAKLSEERRGERPGPAQTSEEIRRLVSKRWAEYGLGPEPGAT